MMDSQCRLVAAVSAGELGLPDADAMRRDIEREKRELHRRFPDRPRYELELDPVEYREQLAVVERENRVSAPAG
jgi:hypothetical protein